MAKSLLLIHCIGEAGASTAERKEARRLDWEWRWENIYTYKAALN